MQLICIELLYISEVYMAWKKTEKEKNVYSWNITLKKIAECLKSENWNLK